MPKKKRKHKGRTPAQQASGPVVSGAGNGGIVPPPEHRFAPGESGNPKGRPSAGATIREYMNALAERTVEELRGIRDNPQSPAARRAAAARLIGMTEGGDLADFQELLAGTVELQDLRAKGVNTEAVKKFKVKSSKVGDKGEVLIEREIELHDRARDEFDRVMDQTAGKPTQPVEHSEKDKGDVATDERYVELHLAIGAPRSAWAPAILARYEAGKVAGYPKPNKVPA